MRTITYQEFATKLLADCPGFPEEWASRDLLRQALAGRFSSREAFATAVLRSMLLGTTTVGVFALFRILAAEGLLQDFEMTD